MSDVTENFKKELAELCLKYNCEFSAADHWIGYAECGEDVRITVEFNGTYDELDLGKYFDGKDVK